MTRVFVACVLVLLCACSSGLDVPQGNPTPALSEAEQARYAEILERVVQDPSYATPAIHAEFWTLLEKSNLTEDEVAEVQRMLIAIASEYQALFWSDAKLALQTGEPVKSHEREALEQELLDDGWLFDHEVERNDRMMAAIANRRPMDGSNNAALIMTEEGIDEVLGRIGSVEASIEELFTHP